MSAVENRPQRWFTGARHTKIKFWEKQRKQNMKTLQGGRDICCFAAFFIQKARFLMNDVRKNRKRILEREKIYEP